MVILNKMFGSLLYFLYICALKFNDYVSKETTANYHLLASDDY